MERLMWLSSQAITLPTVAPSAAATAMSWRRATVRRLSITRANAALRSHQGENPARAAGRALDLRAADDEGRAGRRQLGQVGDRLQPPAVARQPGVMSGEV